jgi:hypothetical protein
MLKWILKKFFPIKLEVLLCKNEILLGGEPVIFNAFMTCIQQQKSVTDEWVLWCVKWIYNCNPKSNSKLENCSPVCLLQYSTELQ